MGDGDGGDDDAAVAAALPEYNLRPRGTKRKLIAAKVERRRRAVTNGEPRPKHKPPPLSKYRRKTANARERTRMQEINTAFEELRSVVPRLPHEEEELLVSSLDNGRMTKITTLRLAMNYIEALSRILEEDRRNQDISFGTPSTNDETQDDQQEGAHYYPMDLSVGEEDSTLDGDAAVAPVTLLERDPMLLCKVDPDEDDDGRYTRVLLEDEEGLMNPLDTETATAALLSPPDSEDFDFLLESDADSLQFSDT